MKPIIFLSPRIENKKSYVNRSYFSLFENQDCVPLPLPFIHDSILLKEILKMGNGLILCGGIDINPKYFNKNYQKSDYNDELDAYDFLLLQLAIELDLPVLGICRGLQVINVFFNGSLYEDIKFHQQTSHLVYFSNVDNTIFSDYQNADMVNSYHHQVILELGENLIACGKSQDGYIEAIYSTQYPIYGIQWHCELLLDYSSHKQFVHNFLKKCLNYKKV